MGLALDESKENDLVFNQEGVSFAIEEGLAKMVGNIKIEYQSNERGEGYIITSEKAGGSHCGGCE